MTTKFKNHLALPVWLMVLTVMLFVISCSPSTNTTNTTNPLEKTDSICIQVTQHYPLNDKYKPGSVKTYMEEVLTIAGVQVLEENCDLTVSLELEFEPRSASYVIVAGSGSRTCYTGSSFSGTMQYAGVDHSFGDTKKPTSGTISYCPDEDQAPLKRMEYQAALDALFLGWMRWNPEVTLAALKHESHSVQRAAVRTLPLGGDFFDIFTDEQLVELYKNLVDAAIYPGVVSNSPDTLEVIETISYLTSHEVFSDDQIIKAFEEFSGQDISDNPETFLEAWKLFLDNPEDAY